MIVSADGIPASKLSGSDLVALNTAAKPAIAYVILRGKQRIAVTLPLRDLLPSRSACCDRETEPTGHPLRWRKD